MSYTAGDFAGADVAYRGDDDSARRCSVIPGKPWRTDEGDTASDADMVKGDWTPVVEAKPLPENWRAEALSAGEDHGDGTGWREFVAGVKWALTEYGQQPADVDPMEYLSNLWDHAEPTGDAPARKGDLVIVRNQPDAFGLQIAHSDWEHSNVKYIRVIRRAQRRPEGAQELNAILDDWYSKNGYNTRKLADYLAGSGVKVES